MMRSVLIVAALLNLVPARLVAQPPRVRALRTQRVGNTTYFHVSFEAPAAMQLPHIEGGPSSVRLRHELARLPQLVPQEDKTRAVYLRYDVPADLPVVKFQPPARLPPVTGLEFVGKMRGEGRAKFLLLYPTDDRGPIDVKMPVKPGTVTGWLNRSGTWAEVPVELDFATARRIAVPDPTGHDPEKLWAAGQAARLAVLEALAPEFGFYGFACAATGRKYGISDPVLARGQVSNRDPVYRQLYDTTTGSAAITQSLQLHRLLNPSSLDQGRRTIDIGSVPGITIGEHPWLKMMGDKKPSLEPLARLVPHDNYYLHFKSIRKFIEVGDLLEEWGTAGARAYEITSREYRVRERYEKQLCLKSTWQGKTFGPAVIRSVAVTGNDGYLREGSDLTVLFHVRNRQLFLSNVEPFLQEARKVYRAELQEKKEEYHGIAVESYVTQLREVSLHRAVFGEFVVYANSPMGLRRVLDAHQGRLKALADSLDFQYMRTVFRLEDENEDGFAFLSDAFIRQLVSSASKIKEKRRLEALTSLAMVTHGAMFTAWETGKLPANHQELLTASALKPEYLYVPEGKGITWDAARQTAVSDVYNTMHLPTPLVELPINRITQSEEAEYLRFRADYLNLWRRYFDPVGLRFSLNSQRVVMETYILPLIHNQEYDIFRQVTGDGTAPLDPARFSPATLVQGTGHISKMLRNLAETYVFKDQGGVGDWFLIRVDDSSVFRALAEMWIMRDFGPSPFPDFPFGGDDEHILAKLPIAMGVQVRDPKVFLKGMKDLEERNVLGRATRLPQKPYKGVTITSVKFEHSPIPLYHALIDDAFYLSLGEASLKDLIDHSVARREGKEAATPKDQLVRINASLYAGPKSANQAGEALRSFLEWESHKRAQVNSPIWYALYRCGFIDGNTPEKTRQAVALRYLGFIPVSPDNAAYAFDRKTDEVANRRHGTLRQPHLHAGIEAGSPLGRLLDQLRTVRVDLRFREDGVHTTVTIERKGAGR